jgi:hypothetical protein
MRAHEALKACPELVCVHVQTIGGGGANGESGGGGGDGAGGGAGEGIAEEAGAGSAKAAAATRDSTKASTQRLRPLGAGVSVVGRAGSGLGRAFPQVHPP